MFFIRRIKFQLNHKCPIFSYFNHSPLLISFGFGRRQLVAFPWHSDGPSSHRDDGTGCSSHRTDYYFRRHFDSPERSPFEYACSLLRFSISAFVAGPMHCCSAIGRLTAGAFGYLDLIPIQQPFNDLDYWHY